jgi:hypothetical protein
MHGTQLAIVGIENGFQESGGAYHEFGRYSMGPGIISIGVAYDGACTGLLLWRPGAAEKCSFPVDAVFYHIVRHQLTVDLIWIFFNIRSGHRSWHHRGF